MIEDIALEICKWDRIKPLIWQTGCNHQIGTPEDWLPAEGMLCLCDRLIEVVNDPRKKS